MKEETTGNSPVRISIIVPVFCGQDTVEKCITSIKKQKFQGFDLIIIDDGSKDNSIDSVINSLKNSSLPHTLIVHRKNQGIAKTLNEGIKLAKGDYILIIHQDCELIDEKYLETAVEFFEKNHNAIAICGTPFYPVHEFNIWETSFMLHSGHYNRKNADENEDISFSEHKCDLFKKVILSINGGFDSENFKLSGEDQMMSWQQKNNGHVFIRNNNLKFIQRYGKSTASFKGLISKVFRYGSSQSKIVFLTKGTIFSKKYRTKDLETRIRNRLTSLITALLIITLGIAFLTTQNLGFMILIFLTALTRIALLIVQKQKNEIYLDNWFFLRACIITLLADFVYFLGLSFGTVAFFGGKIRSFSNPNSKE